MEKKIKLLSRLGALLLIILIGSWIQLPYFFQMPGSAIELAPIVEIEGGYKDEQGALMMTTVSINRTNVWEYLYASLNPNVDLLKLEQVKAHNETDEEYFRRQRQNMLTSQNKAIKVAFEKAGEEIEIREEGAIINYFISGMSAEKVMKPGDVIIEVDQKQIHTSEELTASFQGKVNGDKVKVKVLRGETVHEFELEVLPFPEQYQTVKGETRVGIGVLSPETKLVIKPSKEVKFHTENIGGPSAGLMFTLELINQLTPEDITKGRRIAGTGTMNLDGTVGPIGGAKHKVVAADREGAEIFFAPDNGTENSNYQEALASARSKNLDITIVPVKSIDDALQYLETLK